ncbi:uncharacterized protein LOC134689992 [Mytilus trossulus]|uniref:uncharacterized protein LOC134689992 n=1 Tax=Mytilus trossulus TaxID=6551 RepID=UPI003006DE51
MDKKCSNLSDISSVESDNDLDPTVLKIFDTDQEEESFSGFEHGDCASVSGLQVPNNVAKKGSNDSRRGREITKQKSSEKEIVAKGPGKGPGKNLKGKAPLKRKKVSAPKTKPKKSKDNSSELSDMLKTFFQQFSNVQLPAGQVPGTSQSGNLPEIDMQGQGDDDNIEEPSEGYAYSMHDIFSSTDPNENQIINADSAGIELPRIFEDQTKFSDPVTESLAEFVNNACTRKADISKFLEGKQVPSNCKSLIPPTINTEIWNCLYSNIQQRDRSLQEAQKVLGLSIVPMIEMAEILKGNQIDISKFKQLLTQSIALASNAFFEINIKRRYFIRPYVSKKFQQLCSASYPIEEHLFPNDVGKRMKEINEASQINRQVCSNYNGSKNFRRPWGRGGQSSQPQGPYRGQSWRSNRGRGRGYRARGSYRGKF